MDATDLHGPKDRAPPARLILVLAPERSGSTLLSVLLGANRRVISPLELHLLRFTDVGSWLEEYPAALVSLEALLTGLGEDGSGEDIEARFGSWSPEEIYRFVLDRAPPGSWVVDKTPAYGRDRAVLDRAEELRPHYLWLVRHPLGVTASRTIRRRARRRRQCRSLLPCLTYPLYLLRWHYRRVTGTWTRWEVNYWSEVHERIGTFLSGVPPERWHRLHFESLVRTPEPVLEEVCRFLAIEMEPAMLDPAAAVPSTLRWGVGDEKILTTKSIDPAVADRWRRTHRESALDPAARRLMARLGVEG